MHTTYHIILILHRKSHSGADCLGMDAEADTWHVKDIFSPCRNYKRNTEHLSRWIKTQWELCLHFRKTTYHLSVILTWKPSASLTRSWANNTRDILLILFKIDLISFSYGLSPFIFIFVNMQVIAFHVHGKWISKLHFPKPNVNVI